MTLTIREKILAQFKTTFEAVAAGAPVSDPYTFTWDLVTRQDPGSRAHGKGHTLGIYDTEERKTPAVGLMYATLRVVFEFTVLVAKDTDPSVYGNLVLGEIQRRLREDIYVNANALNVVEVGNELTIQTTVDRQIEGVVFVDVLYRHAENDPRSSA